MNNYSPHTSPPAHPTSQSPHPNHASTHHQNASPHGTNQHGHSSPPLPRQTSAPEGSHMQPQTPLIPEWHALVTARIGAERGGIHGLEMQTTRPRFRLLADACFKGDMLYLVLHQSYCLWSLDKAAAFSRFACPAADVDAAFSALQSLLKANDGIMLEHMRWFASFPAPNLNECIANANLRKILRDIVEFLQLFPRHWPRFCAASKTRNYPIMAWEAMYGLKCSSIILQDLLFTLSRRVLGCHDGPFAGELNALFSAERNSELRAAAEQVNSAAVKHGRNYMSTKYKEIMERAQKHAQLQRNNGPSPLLSSPSADQPPVFNPAGDLYFRPPSNVQNPRMFIPQPSRSGQSATPDMSQGATATFPQPGSASPQINYASRFQLNIANGQNGPHGLSQSQSPHIRTSMMPKPPGNSPSISATQNSHPIAMANTPRYIPPSSPYDLSSLKVGLHLADNRSPKRIPVQPHRTRYYQFVSGFKVPPTKLVAGLGLRNIRVDISKEEADHLQTNIQEGSSLPVIQYFNRARRYRLRLCKFEDNLDKVDDYLWAITPSFWPENFHVALNDRPFLLSRKRHFHFDIPLEVTHTLQCGDNDLKISFPVLVGQEKGSFYFFAVEEVMTLDLETTTEKVENAPHITYGFTLQEIKLRLTPKESQELTFQQGSLNVTVADPLSSLLPAKPVRGTNCKHWECFDLDTWLQSRHGKRNGSDNEPSLIDDWCCPICRLDARPCSLRICDYFAEVTEKLKVQNMGHIKAIKIEADGSWKPLDGSPADGAGPESQRRSAGAKAEREVIEILDG